MRNQPKYLVSACLCGIPCRYDGKSTKGKRTKKLFCSGQAIPFCPEVLGGLSIPRDKAEIIGGDGSKILDGSAMVISQKGEDLTPFFLRGAITSLNIARKFKIRKAVLKKNSPSCGFGKIKRKGKLVKGDGVTTALFKRVGIKVVENKQLRMGDVTS
ncbi:MAG TPA: DUF523 domain-containing protein [candidate division Zixibacteria bacterium]